MQIIKFKEHTLEVSSPCTGTPVLPKNRFLQLCIYTEWMFIIFCNRVFDVTMIIQNIKSIELIYFPYYEPIMIHNRRHIISNG
jgi:hypothetical protein